MDIFSYPIDHNTILRKKKSIKKELLNRPGLKKIKIAILGGSTTSEVTKVLELFLLNGGYSPIFYESEYNRFYEDAVFDNPGLDDFCPDLIYIHSSVVNISSFPDFSDSEEQVLALILEHTAKFASIWSALEKYNCPIIQNNFDYPVNRRLGNLDAYDFHGVTYFVNELNRSFAASARDRKNLFLQDINYLSARVGLSKWFDHSLWFQAKYSISLIAIPDLCLNLFNIINALTGSTKKCLVLDLDNTCWGGVIGDDGVDGICIGHDSPIGEAFSAFQSYALSLKKRGISLAVSSKNDISNAEAGFSHPDMTLKLEDITLLKANWNQKHLNIADIASEINIGLDSLVFVDDNPAERELVYSQLPDVEVPDVGDDVTLYIDYLDRSGYFESISLSSEDLSRSKYYSDNAQRETAQQTFDSYGDFLLSLDMTAEIKTFSPVYLDRITQLTNKTNQFNLTTKRYSLGEISLIANSDEHISLYGKLSDKFGDNGLVSVIVGSIKDSTCTIDLWLMSCRVLKREMEYAMLDELTRQCIAYDVSQIIGIYLPSARNDMVSSLYEDLGFSLIETNDSGSKWFLNIAKPSEMNKYIKVENAHD
ncbi:HAD-IIIC family phosphatase [Gammaproteobacteria bacterium]|nr:HAD-IIIC family phosphatase [Gammaproteobacteria bacterium]MDB4242850.1 HAD-IIIC family phosphatase [Gammaproteobacteria bacterium]